MSCRYYSSMALLSYRGRDDDGQRQKQERREDDHDVVPIPPQPNEKPRHDVTRQVEWTSTSIEEDQMY